MRKALVAILAVIALGTVAAPARAQYEPTRESLSKHQLPAWWSGGKFGIFIHWGVYSVPAFAVPGAPGTGYAEWYWRKQQIQGSAEYRHHLEKYGRDFDYDDFIPEFKAEKWDPDAWIELFDEVGAKYFVLTSKHHDGFALWPSNVTGRNSVEMGPRRDLVGDLFDAAHRNGDRVKPGLYYATAEWFNPAPRPVNSTTLLFPYGPTPKNAYTGADIPYTGQGPIADYGRDYMRPQIAELVERYKPNVLWCDIGGDEKYLESNRSIANFFNATEKSNPDGVVVNDRCGDRSTHYDHRTIEYGVNFKGFLTGPTEDTRGMGDSFGYNAQETDAWLQPSSTLIDSLVAAVAGGGNYLLNIGPKGDGTIPAEQERRLRDIGRWLETNGEAIYGSKSWTTQTDPADSSIRYTLGRDGAVNAIKRGWPGKEMRLSADVPLPEGVKVTLLGSDGSPLRYRKEAGQLVITMPADGDQAAATKSEHSFTVRIAPAVAVAAAPRGGGEAAGGSGGQQPATGGGQQQQQPAAGGAQGPAAGSGRADARKRPRLSMRVQRRRSALRVRGALRLPAGAAREACGGTVTVRVRRAGRRSVVRRVRVGPSCGYSVTLRTKARGRVRILARFNGTSRLLPARAQRTLRRASPGRR